MLHLFSLIFSAYIIFIFTANVYLYIMLHVLFLFSLIDSRCLLVYYVCVLTLYDYYHPIHNCLHTHNLFHKYSRKFNNTAILVQCTYKIDSNLITFFKINIRT
jgi:hypothetical protein